MNGAMMLPEFDHEFAQTRRTLERVPLDQADWTPHEKSFSLGALAAHLADIPRWVPMTITQDELEMDGSYEMPMHGQTEELLAYFDEGLAEARALIEGATGDDLMATWSMKQGGKVTLSMPKVAVLRGFIFNHNIHHRAQLGVYFRLLDVPVPSIYGPSADEQG
jgi:uncharacterized damage-inducible protein DinB